MKKFILFLLFITVQIIVIKWAKLTMNSNMIYILVSWLVYKDFCLD